MKSKYFLLLLFSLLIGCEKVELKDKPNDETNFRDSLTATFEGIYQKDGKGGLFNNANWYHYDFQSHLIWSLFDIYYIKTSTDTYAIQITKYYDEAKNEPGIFELFIKSLNDQSVRTTTIYGQGCGNPYTNPNHAACLNDPEQNVFTYFDIDSFTSERMTDAEALLKSNWDIAFKTTEIKLNAGISGPSHVLGALARQLTVFNNVLGQIDLSKLRDNKYQEQAKDIFLAHEIDESISFFLPDGIDRVIHESYWQEELDGFRLANTNAWWILKSHTSDEYIKLHIKSITDRMNGTNIESVLTIEYSYQGGEDLSFGETQNLDLEISTSLRRGNFCIDFSKHAAIECDESKEFDLRFNVNNRSRSGNWVRKWTFSVPVSGMGPMTTIEAQTLTTGRI